MGCCASNSLDRFASKRVALQSPLIGSSVWLPASDANPSQNSSVSHVLERGIKQRFLECRGFQKENALKVDGQTWQRRVI
jgi:hypothetical protein